MFSSGEEHRRSAQQNRNMLEKQATSIEVSSLVLLKHAANLRGHVLEDTAEVLHSLARTPFGGRGTSPLIFVENFLKVIEKEHFGVILRILLVKPKHHTLEEKNVYSSNREKKILHDFPVFCNGGLCKKGENFKFSWAWTYRAEGPLGQTFLQKFTLHLVQKIFCLF